MIINTNTKEKLKKKYLKTDCQKFQNCEGIKIDNIVNEWYGIKNIPITENQSDILENIMKYKKMPMQKKTTIIGIYYIIFGIIKVINIILKSNIVFSKSGLYEKYKIYNIIKYIKHFIPIYFLSGVLLYFNNCKSLTEIKDNLIIKNWPNKLLYIFLFYTIITVIFLINGIRKMFICFDYKIDIYHIFSLLYFIVYIVINNILLPLFVNNLSQSQDETKSNNIVIYGLYGVITLVFIIVTVLSYIINRLKLESGIIIKDSLFYTLFGKYISKPVNMIITILLISSICIKLFSGSGTFFTTMFLGFFYFIYFILFYLHIYRLLEKSGNYNKIAIYTILLIIFITFFLIFFMREMVMNLKEICDSKDAEKEVSPFKLLMTIFTHVILIALSIYLFGKIYDEIWSQTKYIFYGVYLLYTIIVFTSYYYTIKNSTNMYYIIWFIISCIQHRYVWMK